MQSDAVGQLHDLVARNRQLGAKRVIRGVGVGNGSIEAVVAAFQFDEHQELAVRVGRRCRCERERCGAEISRGQRAGNRQRDAGAQKSAAAQVDSHDGLAFI